MLPLRSFARCVEALARSSPDRKLIKQPSPHYASEEAYAFEDLSAWSDNPPVTSLYLHDDDPGEDLLKDPKELVDYCNFGGAVGTWNANGTAQWVASDGPNPWIIADVSLVQEQAEEDDYDAPGGYVDVIFAMWRVEEGYAVAVWDSGEKVLLTEVMGLDAWPKGFQEAKVWYGE